MALAFNECSQLVNTLCSDGFLLEYLTVKPKNIADLIGYRYQLYEAKTHLMLLKFVKLPRCLAETPAFSLRILPTIDPYATPCEAHRPVLCAKKQEFDPSA